MLTRTKIFIVEIHFSDLINCVVYLQNVMEWYIYLLFSPPPIFCLCAYVHFHVHSHGCLCVSACVWAHIYPPYYFINFLQHDM